MYAQMTALRMRVDKIKAKVDEIRPILEDFQQPGGNNSLRELIEAVIEEILEEEPS